MLLKYSVIKKLTPAYFSSKASLLDTQQVTRMLIFLFIATRRPIRPTIYNFYHKNAHILLIKSLPEPQTLYTPDLFISYNKL